MKLLRALWIVALLAGGAAGYHEYKNPEQRPLDAAARTAAAAPGLSFGGYVTAHYASTHPQRVRTLNLVDPSNTAPTLSWKFSTPLLGPYLFQVGAVPTMADNQASDFLHPEKFPGWAERYRPQMQDEGFGRALYRSRLNLASADFDAIYATIARNGTPVQLIWGKQDPVIPVAQAARIRRAIPALEYFEIDQSGHLPQMEQAAIFNQRMLAYLTAHPS